jgi:hypothetical protein
MFAAACCAVTVAKPSDKDPLRSGYGFLDLQNLSKGFTSGRMPRVLVTIVDASLKGC